MRNTGNKNLNQSGTVSDRLKFLYSVLHSFDAPTSLEQICVEFYIIRKSNGKDRIVDEVPAHFFGINRDRSTSRVANKGNNSGAHVKLPLAGDLFRMHDSRSMEEKGAINSRNYPWTDEARVTGG